MEEKTNNNEKVRLERRKGISFNLELHKNPKDYPIFLRISEGGKHRRFYTGVTLRRKYDWDSTRQKIKSTEPMHENWQKGIDSIMKRALAIHKSLEESSISSADKIIDALRHGAVPRPSPDNFIHVKDISLTNTTFSFSGDFSYKNDYDWTVADR